MIFPMGLDCQRAELRGCYFTRWERAGVQAELS